MFKDNDGGYSLSEKSKRGLLSGGERGANTVSNFCRGLAQLRDAENAQRGEQHRPFDGDELKHAAKVGSFAPYWGTVASIDAHWPILLPTHRPPTPPPPLTACHEFISVWSDKRERGRPRNLRGQEERRSAEGGKWKQTRPGEDVEEVEK